MNRYGNNIHIPLVLIVVGMSTREENILSTTTNNKTVSPIPEINIAIH